MKTSLCPSPEGFDFGKRWPWELAGEAELSGESLADFLEILQLRGNGYSTDIGQCVTWHLSRK
jgi:hypothetical protein